MILCRAVRSRTFFSVKGKNSGRCDVISSDGGRWPKNPRSFFPVFIIELEVGLRAGALGEVGGLVVFSRMWMAVARFPADAKFGLRNPLLAL
jgi:hypothetical protein